MFLIFECWRLISLRGAGTTKVHVEMFDGITITAVTSNRGGRIGRMLNASVNYSIKVDYTFPPAIKKLGNDVVIPTH